MAAHTEATCQMRTGLTGPLHPLPERFSGGRLPHFGRVLQTQVCLGCVGRLPFPQHDHPCPLFEPHWRPIAAIPRFSSAYSCDAQSRPCVHGHRRLTCAECLGSPVAGLPLLCCTQALRCYLPPGLCRCNTRHESTCGDVCCSMGIPPLRKCRSASMKMQSEAAP